jgi:hypothetical protein
MKWLAKESKSAARTSLSFGRNIKKIATRPVPPEIGSNATQKRSKPISDAIRLAINDLWLGEIPAGLRAKEHDNQILDWLKHNGKSITQTFQGPSKECLKQTEKLISRLRPENTQTFVNFTGDHFFPQLCAAGGTLGVPCACNPHSFCCLLGACYWLFCVRRQGRIIEYNQIYI